MTIDITINLAVIHQMIMRYICAYFNTEALDVKIGLLTYEQFILLLKNKFINLITSTPSKIKYTCKKKLKSLWFEENSQNLHT